MIDISAAKQLLNFSARLGSGRDAQQRGQEQLEGAVALHNILSKHGVAYLADEVGMGKTYVALGALALFRHYNPGFRVLIIAPRENIQRKWIKEQGNFIAHNVGFPDLRVKAIDGRPARPLVGCENLIDFIRETALDRNRDFFLRFSSFSLALGNDVTSWRRLRNGIQQHVPWLHDDLFDLRNKGAFKENFARALCCALPVFDLVIVDEAHNLKHGFSEHSAARNRVMGIAFGRDAKRVDERLFPHYGPRAKRVLFLSATPIEENYAQLWNQLDVFGFGQAFEELLRKDIPEDAKKRIVAGFLVRRVTAIHVNGTEYTKNMYRRHWREGGVTQFDEPIRIDDIKQRLIVALVQKKVSELLGSERFKSSFQIGMLASFESFLETTGVKHIDPESGNFDDSEQTENPVEREGIDVKDINRLAGSYRRRFGEEMPHPKMDAVVKGLADAWVTGKKTLVFVRRVASVKELKRKLDEQYDKWLIGELRERLPSQALDKFEKAVKLYAKEKEESRSDSVEAPQDFGMDQIVEKPTVDDSGGNDTFFSWFFRGEGPKGYVSGATIQQRFIQRSGPYSTFFEDNYVMTLLGVRPGTVTQTLAQLLGMGEERLREELRERSKRFLGQAKKIARADRFDAVQAAAIELLKELEGPMGDAARIVWHGRYESVARPYHAQEAPTIDQWLELPTFWTELRLRPALRARLWPEPKNPDIRKAFHEQELRAQMLATAARLGHAFIDLYLLVIERLRSIDPHVQERADDIESELSRINAYLDLLQRQMNLPPPARAWAAFDEIADIADHFDLIIDVNAPEIRDRPLSEAARILGGLLRQQQPVGGMSGQINQTLVRQFRMPGYPMVLVSTDLLQEGEDLHTFCSSVHHYGISWTPSAMEQRIGRVDRVRSKTDRHLASLSRKPEDREKLQVYYPHLQDTVEVLQVRRVLDRMEVFLRLMHEGLVQPARETSALNVDDAMVAMPVTISPGRHSEHIRLRSAFPIDDQLLHGSIQTLRIDQTLAEAMEKRFAKLHEVNVPGLKVTWEKESDPGILLGTVHLEHRQQPFTLMLQSYGDRPLVRCISPVGRVGVDGSEAAILESTARLPIRLGAIVEVEDRSYDLTVEEDVLLTDQTHDAARIGTLLRRVVNQADFLEQIYLPGRDEPLSTFRKDLEGDMPHGR